MMPNTYTQLHVQFVFAVKYRLCQIYPPFKDELYRYISGIIQNSKHKVLAINGMADSYKYYPYLIPMGYRVGCKFIVD
jgi:putative transposase